MFLHRVIRLRKTHMFPQGILLLVFSVFAVWSQNVSAWTTVVPFPGSVSESTQVVAIGNDRFLVIGNETAFIWDGRARRGIQARNTGRWNSYRAISAGGKVLIVGSAVPSGKPLADKESKETRNLPSRDLLLYDPETQSGVTGQLTIGTSMPGLVALSRNEAWVVGGLLSNKPSKIVEQITWNSSGALHVTKGSDLVIPRVSPSVTRLPDGRVMAIRGRTDNVELFNPSTKSWVRSATTGLFRDDYVDFPFVVMPDGRVAFVEKCDGSRSRWNIAVWMSQYGMRPPKNGCEYYSPDERLGYRSPIALDNRTIAVVVGKTMHILEVTDPQESTTRRSIELKQKREFAAVVQLANGEIQVIGGIGDKGKLEQSVEILESVPPKPKATGQLVMPLAYSVPAKLNDGRVLLAGNWGNHGDNPSLAFIVDPSVREESTVKKNTNYSAGLKPEKIIVDVGGRASVDRHTTVRIPPTVKVTVPLGLMPRAISLQDGSVLVIGGLDTKGVVPVIPAQRWNVQSGKWSMIPDLTFVAQTFLPESSQDLEDFAQRKNSDLVLFDSSDHDSMTGRTTVRRWDHLSGKLENLGGLIKWRSRFSALELEDGRVAVIGGTTLGDLIALDKNCANCPDEYVAFGEMQDARSVEVYDFTTRKWTPGPYSRYPGGTAVRLADGRIVKIGLNKNRDLSALEIADAKLTAWKPVSQPPKDFGFFQYKKAIAVGMKVVLLGELIGADRPALIWNAVNDSWKVWRPERHLSTDQVMALDENRMFALGGWYFGYLVHEAVEVP